MPPVQTTIGVGWFGMRGHGRGRYVRVDLESSGFCHVFGTTDPLVGFGAIDTFP